MNAGVVIGNKVARFYGSRCISSWQSDLELSHSLRIHPLTVTIGGHKPPGHNPCRIRTQCTMSGGFWTRRLCPGGLRPPIQKFSFQVGDVWFCGFYPALNGGLWPGVMSGGYVRPLTVTAASSKHLHFHVRPCVFNTLRDIFVEALHTFTFYLLIYLLINQIFY